MLSGDVWTSNAALYNLARVHQLHPYTMEVLDILRQQVRATHRYSLSFLSLLSLGCHTNDSSISTAGEEADDFFKIIASSQGRRLDDQRVALPTLPGISGSSDKKQTENNAKVVHVSLTLTKLAFGVTVKDIVIINVKPCYFCYVPPSGHCACFLWRHGRICQCVCCVCLCRHVIVNAIIHKQPMIDTPYSTLSL